MSKMLLVHDIFTIFVAQKYFVACMACFLLQMVENRHFSNDEFKRHNTEPHTCHPVAPCGKHSDVHCHRAT